MKISIMDASNYFRGLLLLIRKDHLITGTETELLKRIGKTLGFEKEFCETAIHEILDNPHVTDEPPEFSTKELALKFLKDGLALALSDAEIHPFEEQWLRSTAERNGLDTASFSRELDIARSRHGFPARLEVDDLTIKHF
jgi:hypothetical protein